MLHQINDLLYRVINAFDNGLSVILILTFLLFYMLWRENSTGNIKWVDVVTNHQQRVSLTKLLQLVGGMTGTWIMVYMTLHNLLTTEMLIVYLTYVGAIEGYSKFVAAKYGYGLQPPQGQQQSVD